MTAPVGRTIAFGEAGTRGFAYLDALSDALAGAAAANRATLEAASAIVAGVVGGDGIVYVFGSGHSQLAALELNYRAGGIAPLQVIFDPRWGAAEQLAGYGQTLLNETSFCERDCLIVISNSGTTPSAVEIAARARDAGSKVIAVTSPGRAGAGRARSGPPLHRLADVTLDTGVAPGDATVRVPGLGQAIGPVSTAVAIALLHQLVVGAVERLAPCGLDLPLYRANSAEGGRDHNEKLRARYRGRVRLVP